MVKISQIISSSIDKGRRILKILRLGKDDIQTSFESMPYGIDSVPVKDLIAIQMETGERGKTVIVGYINKNQIADVGELKIFATNAQGAEQGFIHLKNNGVITANGTAIELNGNVDNVVKFIPLDSGLQAQTTAINVELVKIAVGLNAIVPGSYVHTPVTVNITGSKVATVKVP
tara:strand:+ start:21415 stop:21936 length:522 start_codon:yes stop_codon:yes gene_type:complete